MASKKGLSKLVSDKASKALSKPSKLDKMKSKEAKSGSASDKRKRPEAREEGRGTGSEYAYAVKEILGEASEMKGSDVGFLGVGKVMLNPKEQVDRELLYKGKGKKLKQGESE